LYSEFGLIISYNLFLKCSICDENNPYHYHKNVNKKAETLDNSIVSALSGGERGICNCFQITDSSRFNSVYPMMGLD
jgi:hypothetical protein